MRSYENSGFNPYNDNYRSQSRGSARNYYSDQFDLTGRERGAHGHDSYGSSHNSALGTDRDVNVTSGYGGTSTYGRSAGNSSNYGSSNYGGSNSGNYGGSNYGSGNYSSNRNNWNQNDRDGLGFSTRNSNSQWGDNEGNDRGFFDRAGDKVKSWFGDDDDRRNDEMRSRNSGGYSSNRFSRDNDNDRYSRGNSGYRSDSDMNTGAFYGSSSNNWSNRAGASNRNNSWSGDSDNYGSRNSWGSGSNYGRSDDSNRYSSGYDNRDNDDRGFFDRAGDEVKSWFGDEEAERRRRQDEMRDRSYDRDNDRYNSSGNSSYGGNYSGPPYSYGSSSRRDYEW